MSDQLLGVIVGGTIGVLGSVIGAFINHWLTLRRDLRIRKLDEQSSFRSELVNGSSQLALRTNGVVEFGSQKIFHNIGDVAGRDIRIRMNTEEIPRLSSKARQLTSELEDLKAGFPDFPDFPIHQARSIADALDALEKKLEELDTEK
jgi:hypothetical protein